MAEQEIKASSCSPEQQAVIDAWGQGLAVMAGAGSGKTTTLVNKCVELLKRNPAAKFAAVSFTEKSASDLRTKLSSKLGPIQGHWVMTIHGLCASIIRDHPREAGFDGEETVCSEADSLLLWEQALEALWMDDLPAPVLTALELLLDRETRANLADLLRRVRSLASFGALASLGSDNDSYARALATISEFAIGKYDNQKRRRGLIDFDDLERGADRALEFESVRKALHSRFELILVDEFQDTNPIQARILWRFARPDASNLCVVGDPKQSIYRFRDADVSVFEEFCSRLPLSLKLTWNFRSRPGVIDFVNRVCAPAFEESHMHYDPLVAKRPPQDESAGSAVVRLDVSEPRELGAWLAVEIRKGVRLEDMALLLRRIRGNEAWLKALTASGIPIAVGSGGLFWDDPRVRECVAFLKWWGNPGNSFSGGVFLRAPWVGVSDTELDVWVKHDPTWVQPFFSSSNPMAQALKPFRSGVHRPGELLMALLVSESVEQEIGAPLLGLWHRAEELSFRGLDFHSAVQEMSRSVEEARRERDVPPPRNRGQLTVLTLHGSKGLEFPHVILVDFPARPERNRSPLLFWDREKGAFLGGRDDNGDRAKNDPAENLWKETERRKNLAESKRVFYVALTRARERLVLVLPPDPRAGGETDGASSEIERQKEIFDKDHWRAWVELKGGLSSEAPPALVRPFVEPARTNDVAAAAPKATHKESRSERRAESSEQLGLFDAILAPVPDTTASAVLPLSVIRPVAVSRPATRPRHSVTEWTTLSRCPRAYEWTYIRPRMGIESPARNRDIGTRVHAALETRDWDALRLLEAEVGKESFSAERLIDWASTSPWMSSADASRGSEVWTELSFEVPVDGEILVGSMDRLVLQHSCYTLVDYKITGKPKSAASLLETYGTQMALYSYALERLEPAARPERITGLIVNISASAVQEVVVPSVDGRQLAHRLARQAAAIVSGESGDPRPGSLCGVCAFRKICPNAQV